MRHLNIFKNEKAFHNKKLYIIKITFILIFLEIFLREFD